MTELRKTVYAVVQALNERADAKSDTELANWLHDVLDRLDGRLPAGIVMLGIQPHNYSNPSYVEYKPEEDSTGTVRVPLGWFGPNRPRPGHPVKAPLRLPARDDVPRIALDFRPSGVGTPSY